MKYLLKTPQTLQNPANDGLTPFDTKWNNNAHIDLIIGTEVTIKKEVYPRQTVWTITKAVKGVNFYTTIKEVK